MKCSQNYCGENKCLVITAQKLMSVVINISKTYYKPNQTYTKLFAAGVLRKNLAYLVGGCVISFVAQWPAQSRKLSSTNNRSMS